MSEPQVVHLDNSRYHGGVRSLSVIDYHIWHTTRGHSLREAREWDDRPNSTNPASYTYGIELDGVIYRLTPLEKIPYANGDSWWPDPLPATRIDPTPNNKSLNRRSIATAIAGDLDATNARDAGGLTRMTEKQLTSAHWLGRVMMRRFSSISVDRNRAHREVSPLRKDDPRPHFLDMEWWRLMLTSDECPSFDSYRLHHA
jgi:N-acetyl-anhydromuramyl-L-alanine amidase AmpD